MDRGGGRIKKKKKKTKREGEEKKKAKNTTIIDEDRVTRKPKEQIEQRTRETNIVISQGRTYRKSIE